jgi:hypothetical protein
MALLMPAQAAAREVVPERGASFTLRELQAFVGGYIEVLRTPDGRWMFLNEDGKRLDLPPNHDATVMVRHLLMPGDVIVGDVILCTPLEAGETGEPEA